MLLAPVSQQAGLRSSQLSLSCVLELVQMFLQSIGVW